MKYKKIYVFEPRSDTAVKISIQIIQAFVNMKSFITANAGIFQRLENIELKRIVKKDYRVRY